MSTGGAARRPLGARPFAPLGLLAALAACRSSGPGAPEDRSAEADPTARPEAEGPEPAAGPDPRCAAPGCLRSATRLARLDRERLQALVDAVAEPASDSGLAPAGAPGRVEVENGYEVYALAYVTGGVEATGTVTLPLLDEPAAALPPADGWPLVVNAHGTIGLDDPCRLSGAEAGAALAGLFGARGAIGVAPDYPGIGGPGLHPYLDAETTAAAVLDAARAAAALGRWQGQPVSARLGLVGLSQGGHAALAAAALAEAHAPELDLRAVGAAAPASGFVEHWRPGIDVPGPHLVYFALAAYAWAAAAGVPPAEVFAAPFAEEAEALLTTTCLWSPRFSDEPTLLDALPQRPEALFTEPFRAAFSGRAEPLPWLEAGFARARLGPFRSRAAVQVWQGTDDADVLLPHTVALVAALRAEGQEIPLIRVPGGAHHDVAFGFLAAQQRATEESVAFIQAALGEER